MGMAVAMRMRPRPSRGTLGPGQHELPLLDALEPADLESELLDRPGPGRAE